MIIRHLFSSTWPAAVAVAVTVAIAIAVAVTVTVAVAIAAVACTMLCCSKIYDEVLIKCK